MSYLKGDTNVARLIPPVALSEISNEGERVVIETLMNQLPEAARIYHNFDLLTAEFRNGGGARVQLKEGEIDAIVLLPDSSIVVVEVKGRGLRYDRDNNQWQRNREGKWEHESSPFFQARSNAHRLIDCLEKTLSYKDVETLKFGYMVVFHFSEIRGEFAHDVHQTIFCNASDMNQLGRKLETVLARMAPTNGSSSRCTLSMKDIHNAILPEMNLVHSLRASVDSDVKVLLRLTREQSDKLDILSRRKRALIEGVAGSGKSVLAVEQARRFAAQGKNVLLLCYNSALASWISSGINVELLENPASGSVEVRTFHDFCANSCKNENIEFNPGEDQGDFWMHRVPELLMECTQVRQHFDAIIVDEGQDFQALWWMAIQDCLKDDGALFVFCDPQQDIFSANGLSELGMENDIFPLLKNCRNTKKIARFCGDIAQIETESHEDAPEGANVVFETIKSEAKRIDYVRNLLNKWVLDDRICPSRIAVLTPNRPDNTCLKDGVGLNRVGLTTDASEWRRGDKVLHSTVRGFKGLDAEFVILVDLPAPGTHRVFGWTDYYVASSRAIAVLHVVAKESGFDRLSKAA